MGSWVRVAAVLAAVAVLAVAGAWIGGVGGGVAGAVLGAFSGVVAGYVPGIRDKARQVAADREAARAGLRAVAELLSGGEGGPSFLLRPDRGLVEFTGRGGELAEMAAWCESGPDKSVRLVTGPGGVGKTRLALRVAEGWRAPGRVWLLVASGREAGALAAARGVTAGPVLLVVDYAETRAGLGDLLRAVLEDRGRVRVLLLARSADEWWDRLVEESAAVAGLLGGVGPVGLEAPISGELSDAQVAVAAVPFFARALGVEVPGPVVFDLPAGRRVPVLVLHAAALVAVLRSAGGTAAAGRVAVTGQVLAELLEHEARYWRRAAAAGLTGDGRVLKAVVAAAVLLGAGGLDEAAAVAGRVPDLAGQPAGELRGWARWLYGLYPAGPGGQLGMVQPDLLAEAHAVAQLAADPALARACLRGIGDDQADRALTVLARAWDLYQDAGTLISAALYDNLAGLAIPAAAVTVQSSARVGGPLAAALHDAPAPLGTLIRIEEALPYPSVSLARAAAAATMRILRELPPDTDKQTAARWADRAGIMLAQAGRPANALPVTEQAVTMYRELAAANPDRYRPGLANSLSNLGVWFAELGRPADALPVTEEAVAIRRELAANQDRYRPDLADSLSNLGVWFAELGRPADALPAEQEAVTMHRELAAASPDRYRPGLARSLSNLGVWFAELGRPADALPVTEEAVTMHRELAAASPDRYRPGLARSLSNLGSRFAELGRPADALPVTEEAVTMHRELAAASPDRYRPGLATSLSNLGNRFAELGRDREAAAASAEADRLRGSSASG